jgi:F-type H+-transporting ATPase subunit gamma
MKIVASTKLNRAQRAMQDSRVYGNTSNAVFESAETKPLEGEGKKKLVVVCSSDKGLCGGIHSGLSRYIRRRSAEGEKFDLVILGEKCKAQLSRTNASDIQLTFAGAGKDIPTFTEAQAVADQIVLLPGDYSDVEIVYNKFINATSYEAVSVTAFSEEAIAASGMYILSVNAACIGLLTKHAVANFAAFEIEDDLLPNLREYALANSLYWALCEGHACEISARRNAMDVSSLRCKIRPKWTQTANIDPHPERFQERRRDDQQVPDPVQPYPPSRHYGRTGRDYHWCYRLGGHVNIASVVKLEEGENGGALVEKTSLCTKVAETLNVPKPLEYVLIL